MIGKMKMDTLSGLVIQAEATTRDMAQDVEGDSVATLELSLILSSLKAIDRHLGRIAARQKDAEAAS